ncbi:hypothetical protein Tco_0320484 [Tanacetum coccineum]
MLGSSCQRAADKAHIYPKLRIDLHLAGLREEDIKRSIKDYFSKWYSGNKNKYKDVMWTNKGGLAAADQIRRERPENVTHDNWNKLVDFWIDPKRAHMAEVNSCNKMVNKIVSLQGSRSLARVSKPHSEHYDLHTKKGVWRDDGSEELYEEMLRLQTLGTMTERKILAQNQGMPQLATMFPGSTTEVGSTSETASANGDPSRAGMWILPLAGALMEMMRMLGTYSVISCYVYLSLCMDFRYRWLLFHITMS